MLFDLQGKRRRVVQATYLTLAVLMGGGLVLFGVGSDVSGGVFDIFSGDDSGGQRQRPDREADRAGQRAAEAQPAQRGGRSRTLVRDNYQLAGSEARRTRRASRPRPSRR